MSDTPRTDAMAFSLPVPEGEIPQGYVIADFARSIERELEWLYAHCRIVYYPPDDSYPIEHAPAAKKDARWLLDEARAKWSNAEAVATAS